MLICLLQSPAKQNQILQRDHNDFWLHYRRLDKGPFEWPADQATGMVMITQLDLGCLLDGLPLEQRQAYPAVTARIVL